MQVANQSLRCADRIICSEMLECASSNTTINRAFPQAEYLQAKYAIMHAMDYSDTIGWSITILVANQEVFIRSDRVNLTHVLFNLTS